MSFPILILTSSLLSPTHRNGSSCLHSFPYVQMHAYFFLPLFFSHLTSLLACQICLSSSAGIILPLGDTDLRYSVMFSVNRHWYCFLKSMNSPSAHQASRSCPHYLPSVSTKQTFSVPIPRKEAAFFIE